MVATLEQIRTLVADPTTPDATAIFEDEHYEVILAIEPNVYRAAATAAKTLAAYYAGKVNVTAGPVKVENTQKFEHYEALAKTYDQRAREGGGEDGSTLGAGAGLPAMAGVSRGEMSAAREDTDRPLPAFTKNMDTYDNPSSEELT